VQKLTLIAAACAVAVSLYGRAAAEGPPPAAYVYPPSVYPQDGFYVGGGFMHQGLQTRFAGGVRFQNSATVSDGVVRGDSVDIAKRLSQYGFTAMAGYGFRDGAMPAWLGRNFRVQVAGWYVEGQARDSQSFQNTGANFVPGVGVVNLAGTYVTGGTTFSTNAPFGLQSDYRLVANQFRVNLVFASDIDLSPSLILTPSIGAYGGRTFINFEVSQTNFGSVRYGLHAHTDWYDIGGRIGAKITYKAAPWFLVHFGGDASLAHRHATLDASDGTTLSGVITTSTVDISRNRLAFMAAGHLGASALYGNWLIVTLMGTAEYDHRQPRFVSPSAATVGGPTSPASLGFRSVVNYRVMAEAKFRLW
jgi:hypothetical protein